MVSNCTCTSSSGPADVSTSGGLCGCLCLRLRCRADRLGRNIEPILVHIESLFPVQAFDKLPRRLTDRSRKTRRLHFDRRFHRFFISISIAKLHLKRFHASNLPFPDDETETGSRTPNHAWTLKIAVTFSSDDASDPQLSGALRFPFPNLCFKLFVLFRQRIAGGCHCFEIVSQLAVLLQSFCILAGSQGGTLSITAAASLAQVFLRVIRHPSLTAI